jgi:16S rRNA (cytosine1407-C5)-methyltransferase
VSINPAFLEYFKNEFFSEDADGFGAFQKSLLRPLKKTLRINTNKRDIGEFVSDKETVGWKFGPTPNGHVFHVDREDTTIALGSNPEHLRGDYYIQELSASMSVWLLADGAVHPEPHRILEIASSPGGKTTQIAEHYPNAFVFANEFNKERIVPLLENIERMGLLNIAVTNMNGVQFRELPECFDLVLLDAPCSGEGIGYKAAESLRYWNVKNVRTIARLQKKLLIAGLTSLKPGGMLVYSTCTLNRMENEEVLEAAKEEFGDDIEVVFSKRFWPHTEIAGGFFVAKISKKIIAYTPEPRQNDEIRSRI